MYAWSMAVTLVLNSEPCVSPEWNQADDAPHASEVMERYHIANLNIMIQQDVSANGGYAVLFALFRYARMSGHRNARGFAD